MTDYELQSQINNERKIHAYYHECTKSWLIVTYNLYDWCIRHYKEDLSITFELTGPNYSLDYNMPGDDENYKQLIYGVWNDFDIKEAIKLVG